MLHFNNSESWKWSAFLQATESRAANRMNVNVATQRLQQIYVLKFSWAKEGEYSNSNSEKCMYLHVSQ